MFRIPNLGSSSGNWIVNYTSYKSTVQSQPSTRRHTTSDTQWTQKTTEIAYILTFVLLTCTIIVDF
jgi:hypothetical protein